MSGAEAIDGIEHVRAVVWDFDGVLNRAGARAPDGVFPWQRLVAEELGLDAVALNAEVFETGRKALFTGKDDVLDRLDAFLIAQGAEAGAEDVLELWFEQENRPDAEMERLVEALAEAGVVQAILTNNETRRARFIAQDAGWAGKVEAIFASGEIGAMKPEAAAFERVETALGMEPHEILFIDDAPRNVEAAEKRGWLGWVFEPGKARALALALMPLLVRAEEAG